METLKELNEVMNPDPRQSAFVHFNESTGEMAPLELKHFYERAKEMELHGGVPERVRYHWENARHLLIYAWFYYPFNCLAQFQGYIAVEAALKIKTGKPKTSFKKLLAEAVANKWITDEGFAVGRRLKQRASEYPFPINGGVMPEQPSYCDILSKTIPNMRNTFAHGEIFLHNGGAASLRICGELINQLFEMPKVA